MAEPAFQANGRAESGFSRRGAGVMPGICAQKEGCVLEISNLQYNSPFKYMLQNSVCSDLQFLHTHTQSLCRIL